MGVGGATQRGHIARETTIKVVQVGVTRVKSSWVYNMNEWKKWNHFPVRDKIWTVDTFN